MPPGWAIAAGALSAAIWIYLLAGRGGYWRVRDWAASRLPAGWTGKLWAMAEGVKRASMLRPDYFLFTDADNLYPPAWIARADRATAGGCVLIRREIWNSAGSLSLATLPWPAWRPLR